jgi:myo-inositol-1(or 4)-monophosphatase
MSLPDLEKLKAIVKIAAKEELLKDFGCTEYEFKDDDSVVTPADLAMQNRLEKELKHHWPMYDILGEEMTDDEQLAVINKEGGYWCIDPLDGTSNYAAGLPFFAVSIALIIDNQQQLGLIYDPVRDEMFTAIKGRGAYLNDQLIDHSQIKFKENKLIVAEIDLKRLPDELAVRIVTEGVFASQRNIGSSAIDWCWMAAGRFDVYLHGGQKLWDYAAGSLIFHEVGGHSISLDNDDVFRGKFELRSILACYDKELFDYWYQWIGIGD